MKITAIRTFLMQCAPPQAGGWSARNWLFVKVETDAGIYGVGEASGWPRVVETAIHDLTPLSACSASPRSTTGQLKCWVAEIGPARGSKDPRRP